jgi:hypothetical protein
MVNGASASAVVGTTSIDEVVLAVTANGSKSNEHISDKDEMPSTTLKSTVSTASTNSESEGNLHQQQGNNTNGTASSVSDCGATMGSSSEDGGDPAHIIATKVEINKVNL